jgi:CRP-like cAMP-binding protein
MQPGSYSILKENMSQFCEMDISTWEMVENIFKPRILVKDELFAVEGEKAKYFGFAYSGCLRMYRNSESGKELLTNFLLSGDFFVGAVNYGERNMISIQAIKECELLVVNYQKLEELAEQKKCIFEFKKNLTAKFINEKLEREHNYFNLDALMRYELFLNDYPNLLNQIPHYFIASYLGISATQLSRIRKKISLK